MTDLNVVEAKSRFSEVLGRAAAGERFVIHRRSRPLAPPLVRPHRRRIPVALVPMDRPSSPGA